MFKTKEALIPYLLLVAAAAGGLLWNESENVPGLGRAIITGQAKVGGPFHLIDQDGRQRASTDFSGRYQLIYFGYSNCPDVCPVTLGVMADALDRLGIDANRVAPIFITIDPAHDTPAILKNYVRAFGSNFIGLTGSQAQLTAVEKEYHVGAVKKFLDDGKYGFDHSSVIYLISPTGKLVTYYDETISPQDLAKDLKAKI